MNKVNIELKRGIGNRFFIIMILLGGLNVLFGYILLVTVNEMPQFTFGDFVAATYSVYSLFAIFIFSPIIISQFYTDYKGKNIMFYKSLNYSALRYYISKVFMILIGTIMGGIVSTLLICAPFGKFDFFLIVFLKIEAIMSFYSITVSFWGFVFHNFLAAFFTNLIVWFIGIIISMQSTSLRIFAYYDSSTLDYKRFIDFLQGKIGLKSFFYNIGENYLFNIIVFISIAVLVKVLEKRWIKNGI
ncbi:ABC transporter permease [Defluviitalea phaphyphila]|uniref:ABC transporter permease n=1 Tax=Defluviitalea phaphyphila TaxID=1473580 RepID=UPI0007317F6E|nr:ABC transporter permease [Defluviitalea phaphyphila]